LSGEGSGRDDDEPPRPAAPRRLTVIVCRGPICGEKRGSAALHAKLRETIDARGLGEQITLAEETCFGHCLRGPNILVCDTEELGGARGLAYAPGPVPSSAVLYNRMTAADLERVIDRHLLGGMVVRPLLNRPAVRD
jgi:(2Fe-2S) ferredoxin